MKATVPNRAYFNQDETGKDSPRHPATGTVICPATGRRGFTLDGHRLASLYRTTTLRALRLTPGLIRHSTLTKARKSRAPTAPETKGLHA